MHASKVVAQSVDIKAIPKQKMDWQVDGMSSNVSQWIKRRVRQAIEPGPNPTETEDLFSAAHEDSLFREQKQRQIQAIED